MIISLEGNIGAGKTSLLKQIEDLTFSKNHVVAYEPVDNWMNLRAKEGDKSLFELYYDDKKRFGFAFQIHALQTRFEHIMKLVRDNPEKIIICERCPLTDCEIFAKMLHDQGIISPIEFKVYEALYSFIDSTIKAHIMGILYLCVSPEVCVQRICKRNRTGEDHIDFAYLRSLHQQHETWLHYNEKRCPVCTIDGNGHESWDTDKIIDFVNSQAASCIN